MISTTTLALKLRYEEAMIRILINDENVLVSSEKGITYEAEINDAWVCLLDAIKDSKDVIVKDNRTNLKGALNEDISNI